MTDGPEKTMTSLAEALGYKPIDLPKHRAKTLVVYWEPMRGSGERIAAIIAAQSKDGANQQVWCCLDDKVLKALYGGQWEQAKNLLSIVEHDLEGFLSNGILDDWEPPFSGFYRSPIRNSIARDNTDAVKQVATLTSSLANLEALEEGNENEAADQIKFNSAVRKALLGINPDYRDCIQQPISLNDTRRRKFGFVCKGFIANFAAVSHYSGSLNAALVKIMDLEDLLLDNFINDPGKIEMIVAPPVGFEDNTLINQSVVEAQQGMMHSVKEEATKRNIGCTIIATPQEVAKHLHQKAA